MYWNKIKFDLTGPELEMGMMGGRGSGSKHMGEGKEEASLAPTVWLRGGRAKASSSVFRLNLQQCLLAI